MNMTIDQIKEWRYNTTIANMPRVGEMIEIIDTMLAEVERLGDESERLRVQLAGCGVAAICNTRESMAQQLCRKGDYGYSASYQDVIDCVTREIDLRDKLAVAEVEVERQKEEYQSACKTIAEMHRAAVGEIVGPKRGVVEDVYDAIQQAHRAATEEVAQAHKRGWEQCQREAAEIARAHNKCPSSMSEFIARNIAAMEYKEPTNEKI